MGLEIAADVISDIERSLCWLSACLEMSSGSHEIIPSAPRRF